MEADSTQDITSPHLSIKVAAGLVVGKAMWPSPHQKSFPKGSSFLPDEERKNVGEDDLPVDLSTSTAAQALFRARLQFALSRMAPFLRQEFENKSEMQRHSKEVHRLDEKGHKCPKCFKSFPTSQQLAQHSLVHTNIRKYQCQYCDKAFKQLSHVQQHQRIHTGERPYKCTMESCNKSFAQLANLQGHLKSHDSRAAQADKKPFCCNVCDRRFATEASLNHHVTKLHSSQLARPMDLTCQVCEKQCTDEERFFKHIHKYHPDYWRVFSNGRPLTDFVEIREPKRREKRYSCPICSKKYSHETGYVKHLATHPGSDPKLRLQLYSCPVNSCQKLFTKETYLLRHMEMKLDTPHTMALDEWKKRPPAQQVMMTRAVSIPEEIMSHAPPPIDRPSSSMMHDRSAIMRSLVSPHVDNTSPQNLSADRHSVDRHSVTSPSVMPARSHQPMEIDDIQVSEHLSQTLSVGSKHMERPMVACSTQSYKHSQHPAHHLAISPVHKTTPDSGAEVPFDLTTGVTSSCMSPGPISSGSSSPPTPLSYIRTTESQSSTLTNAVFPRFHESQAVSGLAYTGRTVPNRSFSMNDIHLEASYGKSSTIQNSYSPKASVGSNLSQQTSSSVGPTLTQASSSSFPRSPEPHLPKSPELPLPRSDTSNHFSPDTAHTPGLSPRHTTKSENHPGFSTHATFAASSQETVPSSPATVSCSSMHSLISPSAASFLHPPVTPPFTGHSGLPSVSHAYLSRGGMAEHEVASALQNLARSLPNYR